MARRSKCCRFLAVLPSGTRRNYRLGPPYPAGSTHARSSVLSSSTFHPERCGPEGCKQQRARAVECHGLHVRTHGLTVRRIGASAWGGSLRSAKAMGSPSTAWTDERPAGAGPPRRWWIGARGRPEHLGRATTSTGPVTVVLTWPGFGIEETRAVLDGDSLREASARSQTLWPPPSAADAPQPPTPPRPASGWFAGPPDRPSSGSPELRRRKTVIAAVEDVPQCRREASTVLVREVGLASSLRTSGSSGGRLQPVGASERQSQDHGEKVLSVSTAAAEGDDAPHREPGGCNQDQCPARPEVPRSTPALARPSPARGCR